MKLPLLSSLLLMLSFSAYSQKVPDAVTEACNNRFPAIIEIVWEIKENFYQADFSHEDRYKTANFDQAGNWIETRVYIEEDELPPAATKNIREKYERGYYESIMKVENNKKENYYDIILNVHDDVFLITADLNGEIMKWEVRAFEDYEEEPGNSRD